MIKTFVCAKTKRLFETGKPEGFLRPIENVAKRKLAMLHFASRLSDLGMAWGNRLEALKGDRKGQYSIRVNDRYRVCFRFHEDEGNAYNVETTDYH
ncbi:MAG: type II toxin-antitoxin system RelE/ParE family toxin [Nitrospinae bacterium]|nr:type II toxin-antitoxin system RelE/ParE family toxin [Nitrospinota bacterium]